MSAAVDERRPPSLLFGFLQRKHLPSVLIKNACAHRCVFISALSFRREKDFSRCAIAAIESAVAAMVRSAARYDDVRLIAVNVALGDGRSIRRFLALSGNAGNFFLSSQREAERCFTDQRALFVADFQQTKTVLEPLMVSNFSEKLQRRKISREIKLKFDRRIHRQFAGYGGCEPAFADVLGASVEHASGSAQNESLIQQITGVGPRG